MEYDDWFRLASHLHMSLDECMQKHTKRQKDAWLKWLRAQWNEPSRTDHYLMQIAQEIRMTSVAKPGNVLLNWFKLPFTSRRSQTEKKLTPKEIQEKKAQATIWSKAKWSLAINAARGKSNG